jgi:hypothetical protein
VSQNDPQSAYDPFAAISAVTSKLAGVLDELESEETNEEAPDEPRDVPAAAGPEPARLGGQSRRERSQRAPRVSRKDATEKLKLRLESIPGFDRHSRKCQICNHPEIDDIEEDFIDWTTADQLRKTFKLKGGSTIYRHARATGLDIRRRENLGVVLEKVVEEVDNAETPTVSEIIRAARTLARLNSRGQWVFPPAGVAARDIS